MSFTSFNPLYRWPLLYADIFFCNFAYMQLKLWHFRGMYPLIYQCYWPRYMQIHYMQTIFLGPYLSQIMRSACMCFRAKRFRHYLYIPKEISEWCLKPKSKVSQHPIILLSRKNRAEQHKRRKNATVVNSRYPSQYFSFVCVSYIKDQLIII